MSRARRATDRKTSRDASDRMPLKAAALGAAGTVIAALIAASVGLLNDGGPTAAAPTPPHPPPVPQLIRVTGTVRGLAEDEVLYAVARPQHATRWFVSYAVVPDTDGLWVASVRIVPRSVESFTVTAVAAPAESPGPPPPPPP